MACSGLKPRPRARMTSRIFSTIRGSAPSALSSKETSLASESTWMGRPLRSWSILRVAPCGPMTTPMRSCGMRMVITSLLLPEAVAAQDAGGLLGARAALVLEAQLDVLRLAAHALAAEEGGEVAQVAVEELVRHRVRLEDRLPDVDDARPLLLDGAGRALQQHVVLGEVGVHEVGEVVRLHVVLGQLLPQPLGVVDAGLLQRRPGPLLDAQVLGDQD